MKSIFATFSIIGALMAGASQMVKNTHDPGDSESTTNKKTVSDAGCTYLEGSTLSNPVMVNDQRMLTYITHNPAKSLTGYESTMTQESLTNTRKRYERGARRAAAILYMVENLKSMVPTI